MNNAPRLLILLLLPLLAACGFHLRGDGGQLPSRLSPIAIEGLARYSESGKAIRRALKQAGLQIAEDGAASSTLALSSEAAERRVLSVSSANKVAEYELYNAIQFELRDADGRPLLKPQTASVQRIYANPEDEVLGKANEESDLRRNMYDELALQIVRRLQAELR